MSGEGRRSVLPNSATRPCVSWPIPDALWPFTNTHTQVAQEAIAELRVALTEVDAPTSVGGKVTAEDAAAADSDAELVHVAVDATGAETLSQVAPATDEAAGVVSVLASTRADGGRVQSLVDASLAGYDVPPSLSDADVLAELLKLLRFEARALPTRGRGMGRPTYCTPTQDVKTSCGAGRR